MEEKIELQGLEKLFTKDKVLATLALLIYAEKHHIPDTEISDILDCYMSPKVRSNVLKIVQALLEVGNPELDNVIKTVLAE